MKIDLKQNDSKITVVDVVVKSALRVFLTLTSLRKYYLKYYVIMKHGWSERNYVDVDALRVAGELCLKVEMWFLQLVSQRIKVEMS